MYQRILIATDGSKLSRSAIAQGVALAKSTGAAVVGFHAIVPSPALYFADPTPMPASTIEAFERDAERLGARYIAAIERACAKAGVPCKSVSVRVSGPAEGLIRTAKKEKCDLIVMASHGRKGIKRLLLGSETNAVLTHSSIPVLVTR
jgi:nucleotide-binding universal stress UspA family protein